MSAVTFNATFYLQQNPDVLAAVSRGEITAQQHFLQFGQFEGRNPNQFFDTEFYLANNADVVAAIADQNNPSVVSAFQHFVDFGSEEGVVRAPAQAFLSFNPTTYLEQNPDLQAAFGSLTGEALEDRLFQHFVEFGVGENRPGSGVDAPVNPGETFDFTTGTDNLAGTVGDDIFTGELTDIQAADRVNGGAGNDTVVVTGAGGTFNTPQLTSVENVRFDTTTGVTAAGLATVAGLQAVTFTGEGANSVNVASSAVEVRFDTFTGGAAQTVNYASGTTASVDLTNGSAVGAVTFGVTGSSDVLTSATVSSNGFAPNSIGAVSGGTKLTTLNIDGSQDLTVSGLAASVTTVNGSAATGDLTITIGGTTDVKVTGGAGDDTFIVTNLTATDSINGGAGFDAVQVETTGGALADATVAGFNALTSIEQAIFTGKGVTLDGATFTNAGITSIQFNTAGSGTDGNDIVNAAGSARTYSIGEANAGDLTLNMKAGATVANVELDGTASTTAGADIAGLTVNLNAADLASKATINISSLEATGEGTTSGSDNTITSITAITGSTVNITGAGDITVGGLTNAATVNASSLTGELTLTGSTGVDTITTGAAGSVITAGLGADIINLGSGDDRLVFNLGTPAGVSPDPVTPAVNGDSGAVTSVNGVATLTGFDIITGFEAGVGGDRLDVAGRTDSFGSLSTTELNSVAGSANLLAATNAAIGFAGDTANEWTAFSFGGSTYAVFNGAGDTATFDGVTDIIVQLNGVDVTALTGDNFGVAI